MDQQRKKRLFERCRAAILRQIPDFAKDAAAHFKKNRWVWNRIGTKTEWVPCAVDIQKFVIHLLNELEVPAYENNTAEISSGRISVRISLWDREGVPCGVGTIALVPESRYVVVEACDN